MSSVDGLMAAMARDIEASAQFASKVWLHSFLLAERRFEVLLSAASATAESLDGSRAGAGYPPALLFALGLRRDAFEEQCRAYIELGWMGARMAAQQRAAFTRAAAEGMQAFSAIALAGMGTSAGPGADALERERADERSGRRARRKPALRSALATSAQTPESGRATAAPNVAGAGAGATAAASSPAASGGSVGAAQSLVRSWPAPPARPARKPRPSVVLRSVSLVATGNEYGVDEDGSNGPLADDSVSAAGGSRNG